MSFDRTRSAGYMTNWAARLFARAIDRRLKGLNLSSGQLPVIFALAGGDALTQKALTEIAAIEQPTMAATLSRMERDGLIERRANPDDKRSALVQLTPAAMQRAKAVQEAIAGVNEHALAGLSAEERETYLALLRKVIGSLETLAE